MRFSTKTTYSMRAMIRLAQNYQKKSLSLSNVAQKEDISLSYLEKIFSRLKVAGLVDSEMGMKGGYSLSIPPDKISVLDIVNAIENDSGIFHCMAGHEKVFCSTDCKCGVTKSLFKIQKSINQAMQKIKLKELC